MRTGITTTRRIGVAGRFGRARMNAMTAEAKPARFGATRMCLLCVCLLAVFLVGCLSLNPKRAGRNEKDRPALLASSSLVEAR